MTDSPVVRPNRDTLYSGAVFDYDAGPVTITLPDAGNRFMSMQVIDEDQYTHAVYYGAGRYTMTRKEMGTRYGSLVRTSFFRIDKALSPLLFVESGSGFTGYDLD